MSKARHGMVCHVREGGRDFPIIEGKNLVHFDHFGTFHEQSNTAF